MTIEQRLAEIIQAFCADALSSTVNLNVDLDIVLAVLAQALLAALRARLPGYPAVTPDTIQRRFLETPGQITSTGDAITVRLKRRAYSPVLRQAALPDATTVPWWGNRPCATNSPNLAPNRCVEIRANRMPTGASSGAASSLLVIIVRVFDTEMVHCAGSLHIRSRGVRHEDRRP